MKFPIFMDNHSTTAVDLRVVQEAVARRLEPRRPGPRRGSHLRNSLPPPGVPRRTAARGRWPRSTGCSTWLLVCQWAGSRKLTRPRRDCR